MTRRLVSLALAVFVAVTLGATTADARPVTRLPIIYVASAIENPSLSQVFDAPMRARGYSVYTFQTNDPTDPDNNPWLTIRGNSRKLGRWVDALSRRTGHKKFDVVGISQTGLVTRYWLKDFGGQKYIRKAVLLSGLILGSPFQAQLLRKDDCRIPADRRMYLPPKHRNIKRSPGCAEEAMGSNAVNALNTPTQALPGIKYYNVTTLLEEEAAPFWINLMTGPGDYKNIVTQDLCPNDPVVHMTLNVQPAMHSLIDSLLRTGVPRMACDVPVVPGVPTLADTHRVARAPSEAPLPPGTVVPPQFRKYYR
ncbi:MAG: lipase [Gordonia sp. (in: high G+C Gram-positive bacteria)]|uniref:esterase/lipase family protein n=1 Tax=Gordonia sp. (in: high G+C Gram-positive bacteria) TaxID=84139 RepID=UPI0039E31B72